MHFEGYLLFEYHQDILLPHSLSQVSTLRFPVVYFFFQSVIISFRLSALPMNRLTPLGNLVMLKIVRAHFSQQVYYSGSSLNLVGEMKQVFMFQKVLRVSYVPCKQIQSKTDEFIKYSGVWWGCLTLSLRFFSVQQVLFYLVFYFLRKSPVMYFGKSLNLQRITSASRVV